MTGASVQGWNQTQSSVLAAAHRVEDEALAWPQSFAQFGEAQGITFTVSHGDSIDEVVDDYYAPSKDDVEEYA
eukprot:CAMPEP_0198503320 /NCGR_PEP_ID=MMETSP1462-20131121/9828_1 /TAXON_ID=1333877 /ORGANISM="Brandtodinium nutriculum, Strain RCC3387" /LENGTH=72 /DNA_ID=CAMNT_0044232433 /DNA_START=19 /DNA_END=235 /DNA_ORIENTATION=-